MVPPQTLDRTTDGFTAHGTAADGIAGDGTVNNGAAHRPGHPGNGPRRRSELGKFLRARRERISPQNVGLPPGPRRRTPGLRREELALLAGVGITWYTWLEQGRPINASVQVLDAVARTLRLDRVEREHLYQLAEATPVRSWEPTTTVPQAVLDILDSFLPCPAVLANTRYDILESNEAHRAVFRDWHSMPCVHRNLLWCGVTEPTAREKFLNYDEEVPYLIARMRAGYAAHIGNPEWEEDIRRLSELSPEFAEIWARHEVAEPEVRTRIFATGDAGKLTFSITELDVGPLPGLRIIAYTPQDDYTREQLPLLMSQP